METVSKTLSSGMNETTVPCFLVRPISVSGYLGLPEAICPFRSASEENSILYARLSQ